MRENDHDNKESYDNVSADCDEAESYRVLHQCPHYRIGAGTRVVGGNLDSPFIEVAVTMLHDRPRISLQLLDRDVKIVKGLHARGYTLNCHDDACVSAELSLPSQKIRAECAYVRKMIEDIMTNSI
jgi:hypothetical protein